MSTNGETGTDDAIAPTNINPGYVLGRLAKALHTSRTHQDHETRTRAEQKIATWVKVFEGLLSGSLQVGSRTPVSGTPTWATLEVAHGGFATGELMAGGPLRPHERELLSRLKQADDATARTVLNGYFLTDEGIAELHTLLENGCYRVTVPEEGALLVVVWLLRHGEPDAARAVLDEIGPFFSRLRFYPVPDGIPSTAGSLVHLQNVGETLRALTAVHDRPEILALREAIRVWAPLFDQVVQLFAETVEGPIPTLRTDTDGTRETGTSARLFVEGGWPCQHYPVGWRERASAALEEYRQLRKEHHQCGGPERARRNFALLRGYLETCIQDPRRLTGRDVGMIRLILAGIASKRGLPNSERADAFRRFQATQIVGPSSETLARVLSGRLAGRSLDGGLDSLADISMPVTTDEARRHGLTPGETIPDRLTAKFKRAIIAPVSALVKMGIIPSSEVLARVIPQITAQVRTSGMTDPVLRRLYEAVYIAFRKRRSLLLLNLEHQVTLRELPWVQAIDPYRQGGISLQEQAKQTLEQVVALGVTSFPQQIHPNKLLQEVQALAETAGLKLPIVDELAADIFMGDFSEKFIRAAQVAAHMLTGTLYERYYAVPFKRVRDIDDVTTSRYGTSTSAAFASLCVELAGESTSTGWSVARNGKIIEQEQILTTHNLAVLFDALGMTETIRPQLRALAETCFVWICRRLQQKTDLWQARLRTVKNAAYAWRQMVFFLSLGSSDELDEFLVWAQGYLAKQRPEFRERFGPALEGLRQASRGAAPEGGDVLGSRRFLGWTTGNHWLLS